MVSLALVLVVAIVAFIIVRRRRRRNQETETPNTDAPSAAYIPLPTPFLENPTANYTPFSSPVIDDTPYIKKSEPQIDSQIELKPISASHPQTKIEFSELTLFEELGRGCKCTVLNV